MQLLSRVTVPHRHCELNRNHRLAMRATQTGARVRATSCARCNCGSVEACSLFGMQRVRAIGARTRAAYSLAERGFDPRTFGL